MAKETWPAAKVIMQTVQQPIYEKKQNTGLRIWGVLSKDQLILQPGHPDVVVRRGEMVKGEGGAREQYKTRPKRHDHRLGRAERPHTFTLDCRMEGGLGGGGSRGKGARAATRTSRRSCTQVRLLAQAMAGRRRGMLACGPGTATALWPCQPASLPTCRARHVVARQPACSWLRGWP